MKPTQETWLPVVGYEGRYEVSDHGRVRGINRITRTGRKQPDLMLVLDVGPRGHLRAHLRSASGDATRIFAHILVLTAFGSSIPYPGAECRHLDGDPTHNWPSNLQWRSRSENALDRVRHGNDAMARKTHCPQGHPYDEANTYWHQPKSRKSKTPTRDCRICRRAASTRRYYRLRNTAA